MKEFEAMTLRLKQQLGVTLDKDVAALLGFTSRAWTGRKRTNSFPERELYALIAKRPELKIDVGYVLTGTPTPPEEAAQHALLIRHSVGLVPTEVMTNGLRDAAGERNAAAYKAKALQELLLSCSESDQDLLLHIASRLSRIPRK